jgi:hypothetical protein
VAGNQALTPRGANASLWRTCSCHRDRSRAWFPDIIEGQHFDPRALRGVLTAAMLDAWTTPPPPPPHRPYGARSGARASPR